MYILKLCVMMQVKLLQFLRYKTIELFCKSKSDYRKSKLKKQIFLVTPYNKNIDVNCISTVNKIFYLLVIICIEIN